MSLALRAAIAVHPAAWREKHADVVLSTLMDVADDRGGRVPAAETLNLAVRGLWLRFRGSVTFWACVVILGVMIVAALNRDVYELDGSLTAHLLKLNGGLSICLPVLAVVGGWNGAKARAAHIAGWRLRLRRLAMDSAPPLVVTAVALLIAFIIICVRFGAPWIAWPAGLVVGTQAAMVVAALAVGEALGGVLPRVLVIFVAPVAVVALMLRSPGLDYGGLAYLIDVAPFVRVYLAAGMLIALALASAAIRVLWLRALPALAVAAATVAVALAVPYGTLPLAVERSRSELVCSSVEPVVCLWPEQDAAFGESLRGELSAAREAGLALGLPMDGAAPQSAARFAMTGIPAPETTDWSDIDVLASQFGLGVSGLAPRDMIALYAFSVTVTYGEAPVEETEIQALQFSIAILLGVEREKAWPAVADPYTGQPGWDPAGIPDEAAARALVEKWLAQGLDGVRAPS